MTINEPLIRQIVAEIERDEARWDQKNWALQSSCGTTYCFAGWAALLSGYIVERPGHEPILTKAGVCAAGGESVIGPLIAWYGNAAINRWYPFGEVSRSLLGLTLEQADCLFHYGVSFPFSVSIQEYKALITEVTGITFGNNPKKPDPEPKPMPKAVIPFPSNVPELVAA